MFSLCALGDKSFLDFLSARFLEYIDDSVSTFFIPPSIFLKQKPRMKKRIGDMGIGSMMFNSCKHPTLAA